MAQPTVTEVQDQLWRNQLLQRSETGYGTTICGRDPRLAVAQPTVTEILDWLWHNQLLQKS